MSLTPAPVGNPASTPPVAPPQRRFALLGNRLLSGSALLLVSTTIVNLGNYLFNVIMGRWLGPASFADVSLIVTLFLVVTLVTATLQTVVARYSAIFQASSLSEVVSGLRRWSLRWAWLLGIVGAAVLVVGALFWQQFFHTASPWLFVILGIGVPIYFAQGVDRGILQGQMRFGLLALTYQAEMWARLFLGIVLVWIGLGVNGAVWALTLSFVATWLVARRARLTLPKTGEFTRAQERETMIYAAPVAVALLGQIIINNSDVLMVKHFFVPEMAGLYAALALIGRIVFFATWSVVMVLLPTVAQRKEQGLPHRHLLWLSLGLVGAASVVVIAVCYFGGYWVVSLLFGEDYVSVAPLLWVYAVATTLFALANVFITYGLSLGHRTGSVLALGAGIIQVIGIILFHDTLQQVVLVQVAVMSVLLVVLWVNAIWSGRRE
ncbi:MAG: oligosaccharide flippase family protein [Anaerolineales bacterium]|nr:oligosaccharide flippase family protein [Anaerolineales bacterium]